MLLDPDAAEYKHLNNNTKELFGTLSGAWEKRIQRKYGCPENRPDNAGMEGRMAKSDGYREMNRYPQEVIMQEANKCVRLALKAGLVKL